MNSFVDQIYAVVFLFMVFLIVDQNEMNIFWQKIRVFTAVLIYMSIKTKLEKYCCQSISIAVGSCCLLSLLLLFNNSELCWYTSPRCWIFLVEMTIRRWPKIEIFVKVIQNYEIIQYGFWMLMDVCWRIPNDLQYINPILDEHQARYGGFFTWLVPWDDPTWFTNGFPSTGGAFGAAEKSTSRLAMRQGRLPLRRGENRLLETLKRKVSWGLPSGKR